MSMSMIKCPFFIHNNLNDLERESRRNSVRILNETTTIPYFEKRKLARHFGISAYSFAW